MYADKHVHSGSKPTLVNLCKQVEPAESRTGNKTQRKVK